MKFANRWRSAFLTTLIAAFAGACADNDRLSPEEAPASEAGTVALAVQTGDGKYRLQGTVVFTRTTGLTVRTSLGIDQQDVFQTLPAGTYTGALEAGFTLSRLTGTTATPVPVSSIAFAEVQPASLVIAASQTTKVTVVIALDDGEIVVIGTGTADIDVRVNDGATCGGCLAGEQCLVLADGTRQCTLPCSTGLDCSPSFECLTTFYRATADGSGAPVPTCDRAVAITAGSNHGCALLLSGGVRCFGKGVSGQLGDGRATSSADAVDVARIGNATAVDAAGNNTCAVLANGEVSCWGEAFGPVPYLLGGIGDAKAVALNEAGSVYVLRRNGSVSSFDGGGGWVPFPAATSTAISAGGTNFCWIQSDRKEFCLYQILDSTTSLNVGVDIQALDVGPLKICDVSVTGTVSCLGDGPIPIGPAASIGVGLQFACAAEKDGSLWCWGETGFLQLGSSAGATPVQVPSYSAVRSVAAGSGSVMTLDAAGHVAWGGDVFLADNLPVRLGTRAPVMGL